jgi:MFS family permease
LLRNLRTFESFKIPGYRVYYASMIGQWLTLSMQLMVRSLLVYRITESAAIIGVVALAQALPALLLSLLGGAIADRIPKKYLLTVGRSSLAVTALGVAILISLGYLGPEHPNSWWILVISAALQGAVTGLTQPALMSIIPEIVSEQRIMNALSLSNMGQNIMRLLGPTLAGFLIDSCGFAVVFYLMTGLYLMDTIWTLFLPHTKAQNVNKRGSPLTDIADAFRYIKRETIFLLIVVFALCHVIAGQPYQQLLSVFTESILKVSASKLGLLSSVSAIGSLVGSLVVASLPNKRRGLILILSGVIMGIGVLIFSMSRSWYLSLAVMPFIGLGPTLHSTMTTALIQSYVKPDYRGRMQGFFAMASNLATFGTFIAGAMSDVIGVQWAVGSMAIFLAGISIVFLVFVKKLRRID